MQLKGGLEKGGKAWKSVEKRGKGVEKFWPGGMRVAAYKPYGLVRLILPLGLNASHGLAHKGLAEFNRSAHSAGPG